MGHEEIETPPHGPCPAYVLPRGTIVQCHICVATVDSPEIPYFSPVVQKTPLLSPSPSPLSPVSAQETLQTCPSEG